ncbi:conserved hypothetical protein [Hyella patelloides LEGE 07179]|uniref:PEP-CTERM sorting domain-containing protein n=1 Tax=Hyella patelloides LEGE 07179 TaxID=945734 RepID=A0A563W2R1_9CYAN|nr:hypothetical protein [Hyella patelloides]VEP17956.1 conserved hypothetical protein [Hyella patelloides LEGE 07179]
MSISISKFAPIAIFASLFSLGNLITLDSANAYSITPVINGDFQSYTSLDGSAGWTGTGSTNIGGTYSGVDFNGTNQGIITTACPNGGTNTLCLNNRDDDPASTTTGTFNLRTQDQISASPEIATLQTQLGLSANDFSIRREIDGTPLSDTEGNPLYRLPKEGSAIFQDITITNDNNRNTQITFNWDFLTNDGAGSLGDKDFGFISIANPSDPTFEPIVIKLEDSTGSIIGPNGDDYGSLTDTYNDGFSDDFDLASGTYRVGFGVIDVDGVGNSSALLIDEFGAKEVPFEFTPAAGVGLVLGLIGFKKLRHRFKK